MKLQWEICTFDGQYIQFYIFTCVSEFSKICSYENIHMYALWLHKQLETKCVYALKDLPNRHCKKKKKVSFPSISVYAFPP